MNRVVFALVVAVGAAWGPVAAAQEDAAEDPPAEVQPGAAENTIPRLRLGAEGGLGVAVRSAVGGPGFIAPIQGRLGVQLHEQLGLFAQTSLALVGYGVGGFSQITFFDWFTGAGLDATIDGFLQLGGAIGIDYQFGDSFFRARAYPGVELRVAVLFGRTHSPGPRKGLVLALTQHFAIVEADIPGTGVMSYTVLTAGFELY